MVNENLDMMTIRVDAKKRERVVIHFTEAGGGVLTSICQIISLTPELNHIIFARARGNFSDFELVNQENAQVIQWKNSLIIGILKLVFLRFKNPAAILHIHSSKCGVIRFLPTFSNSIYSPHCFSHERRDIGDITRRIFKSVEYFAARRTYLTICVSKRELNLALELNESSNAMVHQHVVDKWISQEPGRAIVAIGRICVQKNPALFVKIAQAIRNIHPDIRFIWIGDGDQDAREMLLENNVEVTGWLEPNDVRDILSSGSLLLHCALWEGMPVVFSEALAGGIPVVSIEEEYLEGCEGILTYTTIQEAAQICSEVVLNGIRNPGQSVERRIAAENLYRAYAKTSQWESRK